MQYLWNLMMLSVRATVLALCCALPAHAQDKPCTDCHSEYAKKKVVHAALEMGCKRCHTDLDASTTPHTSKGRLPVGPGADQVAMCTQCHEREGFEGKFVHAPVATGNCLVCHDPHASDHQGLLKKDPPALCLSCHPEIGQGPHVVAGFSRSGHPLGEPYKGNTTEDPMRPGRRFYCASCHEPHRSEWPKLSRFGIGMAPCLKCHKK